MIRKYLRDERVLRVIRYLVAGGLTTLVNFSVFYLLYNTLGLNENLSNVVSVTLSILFAYVINKLFVFKSRGLGMAGLMREFVSFISARAVTMLLEVGGVFVFATLAGFNPLYVKIALNVLIVILNYIFSRVFVFRGKDHES